MKNTRWTFFTIFNFVRQSCLTSLGFYFLPKVFGSSPTEKWLETFSVDAFCCRSAIDVSSITSGCHRNEIKIGRKTHSGLATRSHLVNLLLFSYPELGHRVAQRQINKYYTKL